MLSVVCVSATAALNHREINSIYAVLLTEMLLFGSLLSYPCDLGQEPPSHQNSQSASYTRQHNYDAATTHSSTPVNNAIIDVICHLIPTINKLDGCIRKWMLIVHYKTALTILSRVLQFNALRSISLCYMYQCPTHLIFFKFTDTLLICLLVNKCIYSDICKSFET